MLDRVHHNLNLAFASFFGFLAVCVVIAPQGLFVDNGVSYFSTRLDTLLPYLLAFGFSAYFLMRAARALDGVPALHWLGLALRFFIVCFVILVITPNHFLSWLHQTGGSLLFITQLVVSICAVVVAFSGPAIGLLGLELAGGLMAFYYLPRDQGYLIESQMIFQLAFWLLMTYWLRQPAVRKLEPAAKID